MQHAAYKASDYMYNMVQQVYSWTHINKTV